MLIGEFGAHSVYDLSPTGGCVGKNINTIKYLNQRTPKASIRLEYRGCGDGG